MLINDYYELKRNCEILKEYSIRYRDEITVYGGLVAESLGTMPYDVIVQMYDSFSEEVFYGNLLAMAVNSIVVDGIENLLRTDGSYYDSISDNGLLISRDDFEKKLKEYREKKEA